MSYAYAYDKITPVYSPISARGGKSRSRRTRKPKRSNKSRTRRRRTR